MIEYQQTATINDGTGTLWTKKYTYKEFGAVETRTDARGVVTTYGYDVLHRLKDITYNTTSAQGVAATPGVTYTYSAQGVIESVSVGNLYQAINTFDLYSRVRAINHTIDNRSYTTNYQYNQGNQPKQMAHIYPEYDTLGRLAGLKDSFGHINAYQPDLQHSGPGDRRYHPRRGGRK